MLRIYTCRLENGSHVFLQPFELSRNHRFLLQPAEIILDSPFRMLPSSQPAGYPRVSKVRRRGTVVTIAHCTRVGHVGTRILYAGSLYLRMRCLLSHRLVGSRGPRQAPPLVLRSLKSHRLRSSNSARTSFARIIEVENPRSLLLYFCYSL
jgi:hypothetical protein